MGTDYPDICVWVEICNILIQILRYQRSAEGIKEGRRSTYDSDGIE